MAFSNVGQRFRSIQQRETSGVLRSDVPGIGVSGDSLQKAIEAIATKFVDADETYVKAEFVDDLSAIAPDGAKPFDQRLLPDGTTVRMKDGTTDASDPDNWEQVPAIPRTYPSQDARLNRIGFTPKVGELIGILGSSAGYQAGASASLDRLIGSTDAPWRPPNAYTLDAGKIGQPILLGDEPINPGSLSVFYKDLGVPLQIGEGFSYDPSPPSISLIGDILTVAEAGDVIEVSYAIDPTTMDSEAPHVGTGSMVTTFTPNPDVKPPNVDTGGLTSTFTPSP